MTMQSEPHPSSGPMPVIFAAHGAPILLDDAVWMAELAAWGKAMPSPMPVLCNCSRSCSARSSVCRAAGCFASCGIWLTNSLSTESWSALCKSKLMLAGESSSLRTTE